jgi:Lon protease-like protein
MLMACSGWLGLAPRKVLAAVTPGQSTDDRSATRFLPLFPLAIVAFPGELVLLHIFEPRYKQLIAESAESGIEFGIVTVVPGGASSIGTEMTLDRILRTDDSGNMDVATRGLRVFELKSFQSVVKGKLYPGGQVSFNRNDPRTDPEMQGAIAQLYNRMQYQTGSRKQVAAPYPENLSFLIGHDVGLSQAQELQLLTMPVEYDRQVYLLQHLLRTQ